MFWLKFLGVALAMTAVDWCWAKYISATAAKRASVAANWSALIMLFSAFVVVGYVDDPKLLWAAGLGARIGTFLSVQHGAR